MVYLEEFRSRWDLGDFFNFLDNIFMNFPVKLVCKTNKIRKDGTAVIAIQYCFNSDQRALVDSGISIPPKFWNQKKTTVLKSLPEIFGNSSDLNLRLNQELRNAEDIITLALKNETNPLEFFKQHYKAGQSFATTLVELEKIKQKEFLIDVYLNKDIYFQIDNYISTKTKKVSPDMPRIYRNMKDHLVAFEHFRKRPVTFESLDLNFYEELIDFLTYDYVLARRKDKIAGLKTNTIGKTIKQFKTFLKDRIRKNIIPPIDLCDWIVLEVEVDAVYLNVEEINAIITCDVSKHPYLQDYKNDTILGCLTGLRFSDFSNIQQEDLRDGMLFKKQQKSDHWVVIPLRIQAREILNNRIFKNFKSPTNPEFNRHIKSLVRLAGIVEPITHSYKKGNKMITETRDKCDWITTHTCRRSFCTNEFLAGTPVSLIMKISGHKSERDFYRYIRISPEEAAYKMLDIWKGRGEI